MGSSLRIQRFRVWFSHLVTHPGRDLSHKQSSCVCKPDHTPFFLHKEDLLHEFLCRNKSPCPLTTGRRSSRSIPTTTHCFALHRQSPCLSLWRKAKTLQLNNSCPLPPKNTIQETLGKRILPSQHILAKTHQEFPIKVPFYLPLKRFNIFQNLNTTKQNTSPHTHQIAT